MRKVKTRSKPETKKQPHLKTAGEYYARARKHFHAGKFEDAEKDYTAAILLNKEFVDAWVHRGDLYVKTEKLDWALENFERAYHLVSENNQLLPGEGSHRKAIILARIAKVQLAQGEYDKAIRSTGEASRLMEEYTMKKDFFEPWLTRARAWLAKEDIQRAIHSFDKAILKCPSNNVHYIDCLLERARILRKSWKEEEALMDCNRVLRINPKHPVALFERACCREANTFQWSLECAEDLYNAVDIYPEYAEAWSKLTSCLFEIEQFEEVGECAVRALELNHDDPQEVKRLQNILDELEKRNEAQEKALANYHTFVGSFPAAKIFPHRKNARIKGEAFEKTATETSRILLLNPADIAARSKRAAAWIGKGNHEKALEDLDYLVDLQPDNKDLFEIMEIVEFFEE